MIRDILLPITGAPGDANALWAAIALATAHHAHLEVILPLQLPLPEAGPWGFGSAAGLEQIHAELRDRAAQDLAELRLRLDAAGVSHEARTIEGFTERSLMLAAQARLADLCVMTAPEPGKNGGVRSFFGNLLFGSGRPVLVVPAHRPLAWPVRHAVIAWQPTREATRALHDALPLLAEAASVDVVTIGTPSDEPSRGSGSAIATHLSRHGLAVNVVNRAPEDGVATELLRHAAVTDAQLLVAGGYGHSRLREWVLGGTTRELLGEAQLPVLFSH